MDNYGWIASIKVDATNFARDAVLHDRKGEHEKASCYYSEAANALNLLAQIDPNTATSTISKANSYSHRARVLQAKCSRCTLEINKLRRPSNTSEYDRALYLLNEAFSNDDSGELSEACDCYLESVNNFLSLRKKLDSKVDGDLLKKIEMMSIRALDRVEEIRSRSTDGPTPTTVSRAPPAPIRRPLGSLLSDDSSLSPAPSSSAPVAPPRSKNAYTKNELTVLRITSKINDNEYVPFMDIDRSEKFAFPLPFSDKHGLLELSPKQKRHFSSWKRPSEYMSEPTMILAVSCFTIKQTIISDCSFVASLAISAQYERRFKKKLITSIIYPQNKAGEPIYNPCGKYMIKLHINGVARKVIIDDLLPTDQYGKLLCSYSSNHSELWVSLLEKAYMKVMGGYNFPGSNSNIDMYALTGWIPERSNLKSDTFNANALFDKILERFHSGHCLVTVSTGELSLDDEKRSGLVPTHAYAMLDIRLVLGKRLFQLKNPWSEHEWKGNYSDDDTTNWTPALCQALNYNRSKSLQDDNGIFWIDYASIQRFFDVVYLNWDPHMFPHRTCIHHTWKMKQGPRKDAYSIGDNPQFSLCVENPTISAVWLLLSRHIIDKADFEDNKEFITLLVYKSTGSRLYYPDDPKPFISGTRINSPHYLCKINPSSENASKYTLVVSQFEKSTNIHFTLRVYSSSAISLSHITDPYECEKQITGEWRGLTAGGCANNRDTYRNNPLFHLTVDNPAGLNNQVMIELKAPKQFHIGIDLMKIDDSSFVKSTGSYKNGYCILQVADVVSGNYNIRTSTFEPGQQSAFFVKVYSVYPVVLSCAT